LIPLLVQAAWRGSPKVSPEEVERSLASLENSSIPQKKGTAAGDY